MTSLLEGALKAKIATAFKGKLTTGTLRRVTAGGLNSLGDPITPTTTNYPFVSGIRESFSVAFAARAGIPVTDVRILILLGSIVPPTIVPVADDLVFLSTPWNKWHKVRAVISIDPAAASAVLQAYEIPTP
jgi:hypothetical protein